MNEHQHIVNNPMRPVLTQFLRSIFQLDISLKMWREEISTKYRVKPPSTWTPIGGGFTRYFKSIFQVDIPRTYQPYLPQHRSTSSLSLSLSLSTMAAFGRVGRSLRAPSSDGPLLCQPQRCQWCVWLDGQGRVEDSTKQETRTTVDIVCYYLLLLLSWVILLPNMNMYYND